jgi:hypothetical protein
MIIIATTRVLAHLVHSLYIIMNIHPVYFVLLFYYFLAILLLLLLLVLVLDITNINISIIIIIIVISNIIS